jgi:hypothetical protein
MLALEAVVELAVHAIHAAALSPKYCPMAHAEQVSAPVVMTPEYPELHTQSVTAADPVPSVDD